MGGIRDMIRDEVIAGSHNMEALVAFLTRSISGSSIRNLSQAQICVGTSRVLMASSSSQGDGVPCAANSAAGGDAQHNNPAVKQARNKNKIYAPYIPKTSPYEWPPLVRQASNVQKVIKTSQ